MNNREELTNNLPKEGLINNLMTPFKVKELTYKRQQLALQASQKEQNAYILRKIGRKI